MRERNIEVEGQWLRSHAGLKVHPQKQHNMTQTGHGRQICAHIYTNHCSLPNILTNLLCSLFICCFFLVFAIVCMLSKTHIYKFEIYWILFPQPPFYRRHYQPFLFVQFTLVGRQCSRAVTNKTNSSSIPLLKLIPHTVPASVFPHTLQVKVTGDTHYLDIGHSKLTSVHSYP